jgi:GDP-4-dehydro-6-deoxy-D-mannose reductase
LGKALITGASGFVGRYLADKLIDIGLEVWGTSRSNILSKFDRGIHWVSLDLTNQDSITSCINNIEPDYIFHLAAQSSVRNSWDNRVKTFDANVMNTIHLLEGIRNSNVVNSVKILSVGSSEEYGAVKENDMPIYEESVLNPISPYGLSKASVYMLAKHYFNTVGMNIIHVRPFNHIGPGQELGFVTTDFASQIIKIESREIPPIINVGNLAAKRDFLDVRDIVNAYALIIKKGQPGEVYNICSGVGTEISYVLDVLIRHSTLPIEIESNSKLFRTIDYPIYIGSNEKLMNLIDWQPTIGLEDSLRDILDFWRNKI